MKKIKESNSKIKLECTNCFKSNHIVFNFAYITYSEEFGKEEKSVLIDRIMELSSVTFLELSRWDKHKGFENVYMTIRKDIPQLFEKEIGKFDGKYTIIRLYKNNIPTPRKNNWKNNK